MRSAKLLSTKLLLSLLVILVSLFIVCTARCRTFPINVALSSISAPRRGYARRSRQVSTEPPSLTVLGGDAGSVLLRASAAHSSALSATDASGSLADAASLRRSSRVNFGVPLGRQVIRVIPLLAWRCGKCVF